MLTSSLLLMSSINVIICNCVYMPHMRVHGYLAFNSDECMQLQETGVKHPTHFHPLFRSEYSTIHSSTACDLCMIAPKEEIDAQIKNIKRKYRTKHEVQKRVQKLEKEAPRLYVCLQPNCEFAVCETCFEKRQGITNIIIICNTSVRFNNHMHC